MTLPNSEEEGIRIVPITDERDEALPADGAIDVWPRDEGDTPLVHDALDVDDVDVSSGPRTSEEVASAVEESADDSDDPQPALAAPLDPRIEALLGTILERIVDLEQDARVVSAATRKSADSIDELISENNELRKGALNELLKPIRNGVIRHFDFVSEINDIRPTPDLEAVRAALIDLLEDMDIHHVATAIGSEATRDHHRVLGVTETDEVGLDRRIAVVVRSRFDHADGRSFRPAEVRVFHAVQGELEPPETQEGQTTVAPTSVAPESDNQEERP